MPIKRRIILNPKEKNKNIQPGQDSLSIDAQLALTRFRPPDSELDAIVQNEQWGRRVEVIIASDFLAESLQTWLTASETDQERGELVSISGVDRQLINLMPEMQIEPGERQYLNWGQVFCALEIRVLVQIMARLVRLDEKATVSLASTPVYIKNKAGRRGGEL